jgi:hypothetical protein
VNWPIAPGKYTLSLQADGKTGVNEYKTVGLVFAGVIWSQHWQPARLMPNLEMAPDQFESPNTEPLSQPKAIIQSSAGALLVS